MRGAATKDGGVMNGPTGFYDSHGIPIHIGDLIRTPHYRHRRGGRRMWLYFRVAHHPGGYEKPVVQNWDCLDADMWQCLLADAIADGSEVLQESRTHFYADGDKVTFNERERKKGGA